MGWIERQKDACREIRDERYSAEIFHHHPNEDTKIYKIGK